MTMRTVCPRCSAGLVVDRVHAGRDVSCGGCGHLFIAAPRRRPPDRYEDEWDQPPRRRSRRGPDYSSWAVGSLLLGISSSVVFCLFPIGLMLATAGLATGARGLKSRSRSLAVAGLVFSMVGMTFSAGVGATFVVVIASGVADPEPAPHAGRR